MTIFSCSFVFTFLMFSIFSLTYANDVPSKCIDSYFSDSNDCEKFYICVHGRPVSMSCPASLHWNNQVKTCDYANSANCNMNNNQTPNQPSVVDNNEHYPDYESPSNSLTDHYPSEDSNAQYPSDPPAPVESYPNNESPWLSDPNQSASVSQSSNSRQCGSNKKSVCYFTNWAWYRQGAGKFMPENIDPSLCTHVIYAFAVLNQNTYTIKAHDAWADIDNKFYEKVTALKKKGVKVLIAIGGWNDSQGSKYGPLLREPQKRRDFVKSVMEYVQKYNFDGLDLDLEYPVCWQNTCDVAQRAPERDGFTELTKELSAAFKPRGWLLSAAVSANSKTADIAYDIPKVSKYLDFINLMSYDFHGNWDKKTGHNAPFDSKDAANFNVKASVNHWLKRGTAPEKLILGVPTYGQSFTLANPQNNGFDAPSTGPGQAGTFTKAGGTLAYYEICEKTKRNGWKVVRDPQNKFGPYAYSNNQWVSFDDAENMHVKGKYICEMNLGGAMIWALDFDDFKGSCGCGKYPLLTALNQEIRGIGGAPVKNCA